MRKWLLRQYDIGGWFGGLKNVYGRALSYQSITNIFLLSLTAYNTLILNPNLKGITDWLSYPAFLLLLLLVMLVFMVFVYKVEIASDIRFGASQSWKHHNPVRDELFKIEKQIEELTKKIEG